MTDRSGIGAIRGRHLLTEMARRSKENVLPAYGSYGVVSTVSGDLVAVRGADEAEASTQLLARAAGPNIIAGDTVALIPMRGGSLVAVKIGGAESGGISGIRVESDTVQRTNVQPIVGLDFSQAFTVLAEDLAGVDAHTDEMNIDLAYPATGLINGTSALPARSNHQHEGNVGGYWVEMDAGTSTATNASTTVYVEAFTASHTLPLGTWALRVMAFLQFSSSSASGGATARIKQPAVAAGVGVLSGVVSARFLVAPRGVHTGITGTFSVGAEFLARTAGTASLLSWSYIVEGFRTGN